MLQRGENTGGTVGDPALLGEKDRQRGAGWGQIGKLKHYNVSLYDQKILTLIYK